MNLAEQEQRRQQAREYGLVVCGHVGCALGMGAHPRRHWCQEWYRRTLLGSPLFHASCTPEDELAYMTEERPFFPSWPLIEASA